MEYDIPKEPDDWNDWYQLGVYREKLRAFFHEPIKYHTYILQCKDGTYYTGYTPNLEERITLHNSGKGAKYTRGRLPVKVVYWELFETKKEAMKREYQIKQMSRKEKIKLIG